MHQFYFFQKSTSWTWTGQDKKNFIIKFEILIRRNTKSFTLKAIAPVLIFHKNQLVEPLESTIAIFIVQFVTIVFQNHLAPDDVFSRPIDEVEYLLEKKSYDASLNMCSFVWLRWDRSAQIL